MNDTERTILGFWILVGVGILFICTAACTHRYFEYQENKAAFEAGYIQKHDSTSSSLIWVKE